MAKKFYVLDEQGTIKSADGSKSYKLLQGEELYEYLKGNKNYFDKVIDEKGDIIGIEIPKELSKPFRQEKRREEYLKEMVEELEIELYSYDAFSVNGEVVSGDELFADESESIEEKIIKSDEKQRLYQALSVLSDEEYAIIYQLFLADEIISERKLAIKMGVPRRNLQREKESILGKLKSFL